MEVLILGICHEIFFSEKRGQKLGCVLYTGAHYTRVNTVSHFFNLTFAIQGLQILEKLILKVLLNNLIIT